MIDPRTLRFWRLALQSGLIDAQGLTECWKAVPPERRESLETIDRRLAREAIQQNLLTLWQAQQLLAGRFNGFAVGRYILQDLIGQGGMGRVYLAKDTRLGRTVALKILSADRMRNPRAIARFQREARVGAQLQHENLVRIYDFGESDGRHYLVMEYIEGRTVGSLIAQQGPLPATVAASLGRQVALGLDHAYKKGLIHRDVNPYNILVTYDGIAKLADMGLARELSDTDRFTREGATVGTFDYVAPEQARQSHSADIRSDIYSLGCTLYHMIAGRVPFPTDSLPEKIYAHQTLDPRPLDQMVPGIPEGLASGIARMMKKSPDERFSTPLQVAQMLEPYLDAAVGVVPAGGPGHAGDPQQTGPEAKTLMIPAEGSEPAHHATAELDPPPERSTSDVMVVWHSSGQSSSHSQSGSDSQSKSIVPTQSSAFMQALAPSSPSLPAQAAAGTMYPSDPDLALLLDLGPEPSLSEVLAESRSLPRSRQASGSISGIWWTGRARDMWERLTTSTSFRIALGGTVVVAAAAAGFFASRSMKQPAGPEPAAASPMIPALPPISESQSPENKPAVVLSPIVVRPFDGKGPDVPAKTLAEAINRAIGSQGFVVLQGRTPIELNNDSVIQANLEGNLTIRSEMGGEPALIVTLNRPGPFLRTGSNLTLVLDGLNIVARTPSAALASSKPKRWSLIQAAGPLTIRRSAFQLSADPTKPLPLGAVLSDGGTLTVERSRFDGFDRAIEIRTYGKLTASIRQSMIVAGGRSGTRGIEIFKVPTKETVQKPSRLSIVVDHCTVEGSSFLQLSGISERFPLQVDLCDSSVQTDTLIAWESQEGTPVWSRRVFPWTGRGNRFDIRGGSWVVPDRTGGAAEEIIAERESWLHQVKETSANPKPTVGADPKQVGPTALATP